MRGQWDGIGDGKISDKDTFGVVTISRSIHTMAPVTVLGLTDIQLAVGAISYPPNIL